MSSSPLTQRNSRDEMAFRISPISPSRWRTRGPGVRRLPDFRASFCTTSSNAFDRNVGAMGLNSITPVPGFLRISGPSNRCAVKLSADADVVVSKVSEMTITIGVMGSAL